MKEGVKKSISLILVLTLLVQLLPVVAFGVGDETNDLDISTDSETVSMKDDDAEIVGEEDALREESVKHFRLRDGAYHAGGVRDGVHYQTADGSWGGDRTHAAENRSAVCCPGGRHDAEICRVARQRLPVRDGVSGAERVDVAGAAQQPRRCGGRAGRSGSGGNGSPRRNSGAGDCRPAAGGGAGGGRPSASTRGSRGGDGCAAAGDGRGAPLLDDAAYTLVTSTAAARMENPGAKMRTFSKLAEKDKIQPQKIRSSVAFDNVMDGVSLLYQNYGYNVKESIIIEKPQEQYAYSFVLNLQGLTPTLEADGSVLLRGADGEPVYEIPAPYLADADGATSLEDAAYKLERVSGGYLLTVEADPEWMNARRPCLPRDARPDDPAAQQGQRSDDVHPVGMAGVCCPEFCRSICRV